MSFIHPARPLSVLALAFAATAAPAVDMFNTGVLVSDGDTSQADLYVIDKTTLHGETCIGTDCLYGETFVNETLLKLKDGWPGIEFTDGSTTYGHPTRDWRIEINEWGFGTMERFSIRDIDRATRPFTIEGGAPENALWIDDTGVLGLGTSLPGANIHILTGLQPTIRLEQDGSAGQTPGRWDIETRASGRMFAIRNADSANVPFTIAPATANNEFTLNNDAAGIGLSTAVPRAKLHVDLDTSDATYPYGFLLGDGIESGFGADLPGAMAHIISHNGNA